MTDHPEGALVVHYHVHHTDERIEELMASVSDLNAKVDALSTAVTNAQTRINEDVQALRDLINQQGIDQAVVNEIGTKLDSISASVAGIDPDPNNPPAQPDPEQPTP